MSGTYWTKAEGIGKKTAERRFHWASRQFVELLGKCDGAGDRNRTCDLRVTSAPTGLPKPLIQNNKVKDKSGESTAKAMERYKTKLLAIAAALESLPCASTDRRTIAELRNTAVSVSFSWPAEEAQSEGDDYLSGLARMSPLEFSQHVDELYKQTLEGLRSEGAI